MGDGWIVETANQYLSQLAESWERVEIEHGIELESTDSELPGGRTHKRPKKHADSEPLVRPLPPKK